jgi:hypothetical protein
MTNSTQMKALEGLFGDGPHASLGEHAETYGRLIGSWEGEYRDFDSSGAVEEGSIEVHFAWVLQGLAVQDVWIAPTRRQRAQERSSTSRDTYGTTIRVFSPELAAWHVVWLNPAKLVRTDLIGRRIGDDVVQTGYFENTPIKWLFTEITPEAFTWQAFALDSDGVTWFEQTRFAFRRTR